MIRLALKIEYFKIAGSDNTQFNFEVDLIAVMWSLETLYKFDDFVKSQYLTPSHKDHKVNLLILNDIFLVFLAPLCENKFI